MINQDHKWFMYRPILECCYKCRKPYHECLKKIHPWFCYREAFACSTKCIAKSYWHDKRIAENTAQILRNYPMDSYSKESSETVSSGDYQSSPASHPKLPCVGHMCNGKLCFRAQLCYEVEERYLKNIPPVLTWEMLAWKYVRELFITTNCTWCCYEDKNRRRWLLNKW